MFLLPQQSPKLHFGLQISRHPALPYLTDRHLGWEGRGQPYARRGRRSLPSRRETRVQQRARHRIKLSNSCCIFSTNSLRRLHCYFKEMLMVKAEAENRALPTIKDNTLSSDRRLPVSTRPFEDVSALRQALIDALDWNPRHALRSETVHSVFVALRTRAELDEQVAFAVSLLASEGAWTSAIRLSVRIGGVPQAEIARGLGVMRSTVTRWYQGETAPPDSLIKNFGKALSCNLWNSRMKFPLRNVLQRNRSPGELSNNNSPVIYLVKNQRNMHTHQESSASDTSEMKERAINLPAIQEGG